VVSNNYGVDDWGLGRLLLAGRLRRIVSSYVGENKEFARQYLAGELEVELTPQGTLDERMRAGGSGIPAFFTATGGARRSPRAASRGSTTSRERGRELPAKETRVFTVDGREREYVLEQAIVADFALVRAWKGDPILSMG
jgi:3-oxoacid CoA-transferase subunit A